MSTNVLPRNGFGLAAGDALWLLRKGERCAEAYVRVLEDGWELRVTVDACPVFCRVMRNTDLEAVKRESDLHLAALVERGWSAPAEPGDDSQAGRCWRTTLGNTVSPAGGARPTARAHR
jgi:hypothetical protein